MGRFQGGSAAKATALATLWTLLLVGLAGLWIRSPFLGTGVAFMVWSAPAAVATAGTWWWLRRETIEEIPLHGWILWLIAMLWVLSLVTASSGIGAELALDGLILRRPTLHLAGKALSWIPLTFGGLISLAGLSASLEARYRIVNAREKPATPTDRAR